MWWVRLNNFQVCLGFTIHPLILKTRTVKAALSVPKAAAAATYYFSSIRLRWMIESLMEWSRLPWVTRLHLVPVGRKMYMPN